MTNYGRHVTFIWSIAETLRGNYKQSEYGRVVLPFTVLRRLDCVLAPTKAAVLAKRNALPPNADDKMRELMLNMVSGENFHNISRYSFASLLDDPDNIAANLNNMVNGFSADAREIFIERFELPKQITRLDKNNLLYLIVKQFAAVDLHPDKVSNLEMGYLFEELIRRFSEQSNETAGEHFTPREMIRLMVNLLFQGGSAAIAETKPVYGPTEVGTRSNEDKKSPLSAIIALINDRLGTDDWTEDDFLLMSQVSSDMAQDTKIATQARTNSKEQFRPVLNRKL